MHSYLLFISNNSTFKRTMSVATHGQPLSPPPQAMQTEDTRPIEHNKLNIQTPTYSMPYICCTYVQETALFPMWHAHNRAVLQQGMPLAAQPGLQMCRSGISHPQPAPAMFSSHKEEPMPWNRQAHSHRWTNCDCYQEGVVAEEESMAMV
jgi:hypothetical protein